MNPVLGTRLGLSLWTEEEDWFWGVYLYYIKQYFLYVRGLFAPTGHSFQDTDIWLILFDPKY